MQNTISFVQFAERAQVHIHSPRKKEDTFLSNYISKKSHNKIRHELRASRFSEAAAGAAHSRSVSKLTVSILFGRLYNRHPN